MSQSPPPLASPEPPPIPRHGWQWRCFRLLNGAMNGATPHVQTLMRSVRKLIVFVIGMSVLLFGLALTVLPGPAFVVIPLGLAILATEFLWARWLLHKVQDRMNQVVDKVRQSTAGSGPVAATACEALASGCEPVCIPHSEMPSADVGGTTCAPRQ